MSSVPGTSEAQAAFAHTLFDEFVRAGMRDVVACPGSRSTPLALAASAAAGIRLHVRLDERSAGFFAIGLSLATGRPVGIFVTSGTAAAELHAAVVEADLSHVPLVVLTADRPPELRGVGAPQTIDQVKLYGSAVRRYEDPGVIRVGTEATWRPLAARSVSAALGGEGSRGPVHLNLPFVEPLASSPSHLPPGREGTSVWRTTHEPAEVGPVLAREVGGRRVLVVAGRSAGDPAAVLGLASLLGWPVLADPLSGLRVDHPNVVGAADGLLRDGELRDHLAPEVVVVLGGPPASRVVNEAIVEWAPRVIAVHEWGAPPDPWGIVSDVVRASPGDWALAVAGEHPEPGPQAYLDRWARADAAVQRVYDELTTSDALTEPGVARLVSRSLGGSVPLVVSSSMPVRDLEWFGAKSADPPRVFANRGANGIDGVVSTALGVASGARAVALLGDLAFLHDAGALADGLGEHGGTCVLVVVDNGGGGIFSFLPQRSTLAQPAFERLFATPPRADVESVALGFGAAAGVVESPGALEDALRAGLASPGVTVVVARVPDRDANVVEHARLVDAAVASARAALKD
jgi:2-succinyl-5-enolpyruvyl-6-hydroxy-3-cyclohexene-1-carboxylate synthase